MQPRVWRIMLLCAASVADNAVRACLCGRWCARMHACIAEYATACKLVIHIMQMCSCLCGIYNLCAKCATTCICVWQIMQMYSCLRGRYNMCSRMYGCMRLLACLCGRECRACMPVWRILQLHAWLCGKYRMCRSIWDRMQPRASLCGGLCDCMHVCVWQTMRCLCGRVWHCVPAYGADPTCVADYATPCVADIACVADCAPAIFLTSYIRRIVQRMGTSSRSVPEVCRSRGTRCHSPRSPASPWFAYRLHCSPSL